MGEFLTRDDKNKDDPLLRDPLSPNRLRQSSDPNTIIVQPAAHFIPELGGSVTSAERQIVDRLAVQIVSMMERPW